MKGWTVRQYQSKLGEGSIDISELQTELYLSAKEANKDIHAFLHLAKPQTPSTHGPLAGVPLAIKDNIAVRGMPLTCGSKILESYTPSTSAACLSKVEAQGAYVLGKTNLDEFGMGSSGEHSAYEPPRNPWNLECVPGGSSGGSAAAVAAGLTPWALGSDTGGSIRQPAAFCGIWGLRPTYGSVSRRGLVAYASSLDQIGPMALDLDDLILLFELISSPYDALDETMHSPSVLHSARDPSTGSLTFGIPQAFYEVADSSCQRSLDLAANVLIQAGYRQKEVSVPHLEYSLSIYYVLACAEASSNLARYDGIRFGPASAIEPKIDLETAISNYRGSHFGEEVVRRILTGTFVLSEGYRDAYYDLALRARAQFQQDFRSALSSVDFMLTPTVPFPAFKLGERLKDPWQMYAADICTASINLADVPALHAPIERAQDGLPRGVQLVASPHQESILFKAGKVLQNQFGVPPTAPLKGSSE